MKREQAIFEWEYTDDGVALGTIFRSEAVKGLYLKQLQIHSNASVTYRTNLIRNLGGTQLPTINGSIIVDNIDKLIDQEIEFVFTDMVANEMIRLVFVVEDRD